MNKERNFETTEGVEVLGEVCEVAEMSHKNIAKPIIILAGLVGGGALAYTNKKKGWLDKWRIKRLEKKGYTVLPAFPEINDDDVKDDSENSK